jgi:hypothetical protein
MKVDLTKDQLAKNKESFDKRCTEIAQSNIGKVRDYVRDGKEFEASGTKGFALGTKGCIPYYKVYSALLERYDNLANGTPILEEAYSGDAGMVDLLHDVLVCIGGTMESTDMITEKLLSACEQINALKAALARADYQADCGNCKHRGAVDVCQEPECDCGKCPNKCVCGSCQDGSCWEWKGDGCHEQ